MVWACGEDKRGGNETLEGKDLGVGTFAEQIGDVLVNGQVKSTLNCRACMSVNDSNIIQAQKHDIILNYLCQGCSNVAIMTHLA